MTTEETRAMIQDLLVSTATPYMEAGAGRDEFIADWQKNHNIAFEGVQAEMTDLGFAVMERVILTQEQPLALITGGLTTAFILGVLTKTTIDLNERVK